MKQLFSLLTVLFITVVSFSQDVIQFEQKIIEKSGTEKVLQLKAVATKGAKILSHQFRNPDVSDGTSFEFQKDIQKYLKDSIAENGTPVNIEALVEYKVSGYDSVIWEQKISIPASDSARIKGIASIAYYSDEDGVGVEKKQISREVKGTTEVNNTPKNEVNFKNEDNLKNAINNYEYKSLWALFIGAIGIGFLAFLTPCVYALVPVTVSMFLKKSKTSAQGKKNIFIYALSIVVIFTLVGALSGVLFSQDQLYRLSTHWIFNLFIFALFVIFGLSFLGMFEIQLPNSWANAANKKGNINSLGGIFFMALTLAIVSFSCTGIFVANLLTTGAAIFGKAGPVLGMLGFGVGLAAPFMIFAIKPGLLTVLTKSGGWQNALKVTLGFVELALALKFLSNADLDRQWRLLDREIFLVLWIVLFGLLGIYLLGKLKFKHDSDLPKNDWGLPYLPVPRLILAITSLAFAIYLIPGLWGAELKAVSAFVPPMGTQDFIIGGNHTAAVDNTKNSNNNVPAPVKYVKDLKLYHPAAAIKNNLSIYHDYDEAMAVAKVLKKPILLDFTGIQCVNCRKFEGAIWPHADVVSRMKNDFVIASLFTDYKEELSDNEKKYSELLKANIVTVGDKYKDLQMQLINTVAQPNYVFVDLDGKLLFPTGYGYEPSESVPAFVAHLDKVKAEFQKRFP